MTTPEEPGPDQSAWWLWKEEVYEHICDAPSTKACPVSQYDIDSMRDFDFAHEQLWAEKEGLA